MVDGDSDSDAPEELTAEEGIKQDEEIRKIQTENAIRVAREGKERRRQWAQRNTPQKLEDDGVQSQELSKTGDDGYPGVMETEQAQDGPIIPGMLPSNIVEILAAREKKTFSSDSDEEIINQKPTTKKRRQRLSGPETVLFKEIPPAQCQQNSMEFLQRRKMQVPRSYSVLKNSKQALRLLSSHGRVSGTS